MAKGPPSTNRTFPVLEKLDGSGRTFVAGTRADRFGLMLRGNVGIFRAFARLRAALMGADLAGKPVATPADGNTRTGDNPAGAVCNLAGPFRYERALPEASIRKCGIVHAGAGGERWRGLQSLFCAVQPAVHGRRHPHF